jgi:geranylgeranyl reductase family protein
MMDKNSFPQKAEVLIVGAGPGGSTLAYQLARLGIDVVLLDKAKFPRGKTCGGGLNVRTQKLLPFDLTPVVEEAITSIAFTCNFDEPFTRRYPEPLMFTVRREIFDHFLVRQAEQAGAKFFDQNPFLSLASKDGSIEVETPAGTCTAKYVVGADGTQSTLAKKLGLMQDASYLLAMHSEAPTSIIPDWEPDLIHIDWGSVKRGYAYLFPKKYFLSLGAGGAQIPAAKIKNYHRAFLTTRWQKEGPPPFSAAGFLIPLRKKRAPIHKDRCLLLGDAAGLVDPFTGEGMYWAIRSACTAARVLPQALNNGWGSLKPYQDGIDRDLMPELECSRFFRELFNLRPRFYHQRIAERERWWKAMAKVMRGEKSFLEIKKKLGPLGSLLVRMAR